MPHLAKSHQPTAVPQQLSHQAEITSALGIFVCEVASKKVYILLEIQSSSTFDSPDLGHIEFPIALHNERTPMHISASVDCAICNTSQGASPDISFGHMYNLHLKHLPS
jgi:hypothetical protein